VFATCRVSYHSFVIQVSFVSIPHFVFMANKLDHINQQLHVSAMRRVWILNTAACSSPVIDRPFSALHDLLPCFRKQTPKAGE
jgi:hypothetical protein